MNLNFRDLRAENMALSPSHESSQPASDETGRTNENLNSTNTEQEMGLDLVHRTPVRAQQTDRSAAKMSVTSQSSQKGKLISLHEVMQRTDTLLNKKESRKRYPHFR